MAQRPMSGSSGHEFRALGGALLDSERPISETLKSLWLSGASLLGHARGYVTVHLPGELRRMIPAEGASAFHSARGELGCPGRLEDHALQRPRKRVHVAYRHELTRAAQHLAQRGDVVGDDRRSASHAFERWQAEALGERRLKERARRLIK